MPLSTEHIAKWIQDARHARGLSQRALAAKSGLPQAHLSRFETGQVDLRTSSLVELVRALDLELMLVPRQAIGPVKALIGLTTTPDSPVERPRPAFRPDDDDDEGDDDV